MKSILDQIKERKEDAKMALDLNKELCDKLDNLSAKKLTDTDDNAKFNHNLEWLDTYDELDKVEKKAIKKVIDFAAILGIVVTKKEVHYDYQRSQMFSRLCDYAEEISYRTKRVIELFNESRPRQ